MARLGKCFVSVFVMMDLSNLSPPSCFIRFNLQNSNHSSKAMYNNVLVLQSDFILFIFSIFVFKKNCRCFSLENANFSSALNDVSGVFFVNLV